MRESRELGSTKGHLALGHVPLAAFFCLGQGGPKPKGQNFCRHLHLLESTSKTRTDSIEEVLRLQAVQTTVHKSLKG